MHATTEHRVTTCRRCGRPLRHDEPSVRGLHAWCEPADAEMRHGTRRSFRQRRDDVTLRELRLAA